MKNLDDWHSISEEDFRNQGGKGLLEHYYKGSLLSVLQEVDPKHCWMAWRLKQNIPSGYWSKKNQRSFMEWLASELGYKNFDDWYNITSLEIQNRGGASLLAKHYGDSPSEMVCSIFEEHEWRRERFIRVPNGYWDNTQNQRLFMDNLSNEFGYKKKEDWYNVTFQKIQQHGGSTILSKYEESPSLLLQSVYPEHHWNLFKFKTVPRNFWDEQKNQIDFLDDLGKTLGLKDMNGWYSVTKKEIQDNGGAGLIAKFGDSPTNLLRSAYSYHRWTKDGFTKARTQRLEKLITMK